VLDMRVNIEARRPQATYEHLVAAPRELHLRTFKPLIQRQHLIIIYKFVVTAYKGTNFMATSCSPKTRS
jgi:hypothetical protein